MPRGVYKRSNKQRVQRTAKRLWKTRKAWTMRDGKKIRIWQMSDDHLENAIKGCEKIAIEDGTAGHPAYPYLIKERERRRYLNGEVEAKLAQEPELPHLFEPAPMAAPVSQTIPITIPPGWTASVTLTLRT